MLLGALAGSATTSDLYEIDPVDASTTSLGSIGRAITGLAVDPTDGTLYGVSSPNSAVEPKSLFTIDPATGTATLVGPLLVGATPAVAADVAFDATGQLWAFVPESTRQLATLNKTTGALTLIGVSGMTGGDCGYGMDFVGGVLYSLAGETNGNYYTLNLTTGARTVIGMLSGATLNTCIGAAAYNAATSTMWALCSVSSSSELFTVNLGTGTETPVGLLTPHGGRWDALAFLTEEPEPEPGVIEGFSIAFDDNPMQSNPDWTRIDTLAGCHVQEWTIDRGRPTEFDKTDTGTAVVRLIDRAGLFDPTNFSSSYNGKILPGKQAAIALQNPVSDTWFTLFRGFIESWHYRLDQTRQYMELELQLVDGFAILARAILMPGEHGATPGPPPYTSPPYATDEEAEAEQALAELAAGNVVYGETLGSVGTDRIIGILEDVGWPDAMRDVFTGNVRVGPKAYNGSSALDAIWDAVDAEFPGVANCWMSKEGVFVFHGRQARFRPDVAEYNINKRTVGDPSGWELDEDVVPIAELEWSNGQDNLFNAASATPQWVGTGATIRPLNPGEPDNDNVEGQYVKATAGTPTSIVKYGLRSITFDQLQTIEGIATGDNSMVEVKKYATYYVENYQEPEARISRMVFKSRRPGNTNGTALWLHLTRCELSDLLTVQTAHPGGGGFLEEQFYVEGIHYTCRPGPPAFPIVELSLDLSPRAHYTTNPFDEDTDP